MFEEAAARADFGKASARRSGRNPNWPYVAVIDHGEQATGVHTTRTETILKVAFATRDEAIQEAQRQIDFRRRSLAKRLALPGYRALREQHGLPTELADCQS
jgi:hypothetical protein